MTPAKARRLFKAGASARAVMLDAGVRQATIAATLDLPQSRVADVLAGRRVNGPVGRQMAREIYDEIAARLAILPIDIPEARPYVDGAT